MKKINENRLNMFKSVNAILDENKSIVDSIPAFQRLASELSENLNKLEEASLQYKKDTEEKSAKSKVEAEEDLIEVLVEASAALYLFGQQSGDTTLENSSNFRKSTFKQMRDNVLVIEAKAIIEKAKNFSADLEFFGFSTARIELLEERFKQYESAFTQKDTGVINSANSKQNLEKLFKDTNALLRNSIDAVIEIVRNTHNDFYNKYHTARTIYDI